MEGLDAELATKREQYDELLIAAATGDAPSGEVRHQEQVSDQEQALSDQQEVLSGAESVQTPSVDVEETEPPGKKRQYVDAEGWPCLSPPPKAKPDVPPDEIESISPRKSLGQEMETWKIKSERLKASLSQYNASRRSPPTDWVKDRSTNFCNHKDMEGLRQKKNTTDHSRRRQERKYTEMERLMHHPTQRERGRKRNPLPLDETVSQATRGTETDALAGHRHGKIKEREAVAEDPTLEQAAVRHHSGTLSNQTPSESQSASPVALLTATGGDETTTETPKTSIDCSPPSQPTTNVPFDEILEINPAENVGI